MIAPHSLLIGAFLLTALIRIAQGSATVAMITAVGIVSPFVQGDSNLPFHTVYLALAIGCGAKMMPWMNDSGFWQVSSMSGLTVGQTLRTFSAALSIMGLVGMGITLVGAWVLPLK
jgi:gluconate:H+ symporter, GntP family